MKGPTRGPGSTGATPATRARPRLPELYGLAEIADLVGWSQTNKIRLRAKLPPADVELRMGPVWYARTIDRWLQKTEVVEIGHLDRRVGNGTTVH